jgi:hypothetical protein
LVTAITGKGPVLSGEAFDWLMRDKRSEIYARLRRSMPLPGAGGINSLAGLVVKIAAAIYIFHPLITP